MQNGLSQHRFSVQNAMVYRAKAISCNYIFGHFTEITILRQPIFSAMTGSEKLLRSTF